MSDMPDKIIARPMMGTQPQGETHKSGPWSIDDPYANGKLYVSADLPPTREQIMADPRVMALVDSIAKSVDYFPTDVVECRGDKCRLPWCESCFGAADAYASLQNAHDDLDALHAALAALTDNEGETE